jgi:hypothetical protein
MSKARHRRDPQPGDDSKLRRLLLVAAVQALIREALEFVVQEWVRHGGPR